VRRNSQIDSKRPDWPQASRQDSGDFLCGYCVTFSIASRSLSCCACSVSGTAHFSTTARTQWALSALFGVSYSDQRSLLIKSFGTLTTNEKREQAIVFYWRLRSAQSTW